MTARRRRLYSPQERIPLEEARLPLPVAMVAWTARECGARVWAYNGYALDGEPHTVHVAGRTVRGRRRPLGELKPALRGAGFVRVGPSHWRWEPDYAVPF